MTRIYLRLTYSIWLIGFISIMVFDNDAAADNSWLAIAKVLTQISFASVVICLFFLLLRASKLLAIFMLSMALISIPLTLADYPSVASLFWGLWLITLTLLLLKAKPALLPTIIGYLPAIAGVGYLLMFASEILLPGLLSLSSIVFLLSVAEPLFALWVIVKGLDNSKQSQ